MNGYLLRVRLRRTGAERSAQRVLSVSDAALGRLARSTLCALGVLLLLLAPFAMAALTRPEGTF